MRLAALQAAMHAYLTDAPDAGLPALVSADHPGLKVYHNNYRAQLRDCLRDTYAQCWAWLGDADFDAAASAYIDAHPPESWTLDAYGEGFAALLGARLPQDPEVAELAWLEWAMRRAFDGADAAPIDPAALGAVDWDSARFTFVPTMCLGTMTTNAAAIWTALANEAAPPAAMRLPAPATMVVWRQDLVPSFRTLEDGEAMLLSSALAGLSFGEMCEALARDLGAGEDAAATVSATAGAALAQWLHDGLLTHVGG